MTPFTPSDSPINLVVLCARLSPLISINKAPNKANNFYLNYSEQKTTQKLYVPHILRKSEKNRRTFKDDFAVLISL